MKNYNEYKIIVTELMNSTSDDYMQCVNKGLVIKLENNINGKNYRLLTKQEFLEKREQLPYSRIDNITYAEILKRKILSTHAKHALIWWEKLSMEEKTIKQIRYGCISPNKTIYDLTVDEIERIFNYSIMYF